MRLWKKACYTCELFVSIKTSLENVCLHVPCILRFFSEDKYYTKDFLRQKSEVVHSTDFASRNWFMSFTGPRRISTSPRESLVWSWRSLGYLGLHISCGFQLSDREAVFLQGGDALDEAPVRTQENLRCQKFVKILTCWLKIRMWGRQSWDFEVMVE